MDYASNSKREKQNAEEKPEKNIERVVTGEVLVKKKSIGAKFKDLFIMADFRSVFSYVVTDVLLPAARNMIVDASNEGVKRMMYGNSATRRSPYGPGPRITYNTPVSRSFGGSPLRNAPALNPAPRNQRSVREDFILSSREEAEMVLERMNDIIDQYEVVSVADFNDLVGFPSNHVDNKWGWTFLGDVQIRQIREGYLMDLPPAEPIQ